MKFPSIAAVAAELRTLDTDVGTPTHELPEDDRHVDVRLQVYPDGDWAIRVGDSSYDLDHRGYWGASCVPCNNGRFNSESVARELIDQAKEMHAMEVTP